MTIINYYIKRFDFNEYFKEFIIKSYFIIVDQKTIKLNYLQGIVENAIAKTFIIVDYLYQHIAITFNLNSDFTNNKVIIITITTNANFIKINFNIGNYYIIEATNYSGINYYGYYNCFTFFYTNFINYQIYHCNQNNLHLFHIDYTGCFGLPPHCNNIHHYLLIIINNNYYFCIYLHIQSFDNNLYLLYFNYYINIFTNALVSNISYIVII